jgi:hypothetical protein
MEASASQKKGNFQFTFLFPILTLKRIWHTHASQFDWGKLAVAISIIKNTNSTIMFCR